MARSKTSRRLFSILVIAGLVGVGFVFLGAFRAGSAPTIVIEPALPAIGKSTPIHITVEEPKRGLSSVRV